jgi:hypothetical protein
MQFSKNQCPQTITNIGHMKNTPYWEGVGSLMYAAVGMWPDIVLAVSTLTQFSDNPGQVHWDTVKGHQWLHQLEQSDHIHPNPGMLDSGSKGYC